MTDTPGRAPYAPRDGSVLRALTGLRGLAAWWVVVFHFHELLPHGSTGEGTVGTVVDHGYLAVDLFFVLSGFIISLNYLPDFGVFAWRTYLRFLVLRLGRIYPLHLFMMIAFLVNPLAILLFSNEHTLGQRYDAAYYVMSLLLVQNWGFTDSLAWNVPAWSISTEWFAYLVFPALAMLARYATTVARAAAGIAVSTLILAAVSVFVSSEIPANGLFRCVLEFASGGSVYLIWRRRGRAGRGWSEAATAAGICLACCAVVLPRWETPVAALAWCGLIYGLADARTALARALSGKWIFVIGEYSYSTYLVHYFVRDWIKFLLVDRGAPWPVEMAVYVAATAAGSVLLFLTVEVPGRNLVRRIVGRGRLAVAPIGHAG